jgi:Flp pilus assembly protein TadB
VRSRHQPTGSGHRGPFKSLLEPGLQSLFFRSSVTLLVVTLLVVTLLVVTLLVVTLLVVTLLVVTLLVVTLSSSRRYLGGLSWVASSPSQIRKGESARPRRP